MAPGKDSILSTYSDACNSAKWPQYNPFKIGEKNFKISHPKIQKIDILWPKNGQKNDQKI